MLIQQNFPRIHVIEARNQRTERRFANGRGPDQRNVLAGLYLQREMPQDILVVVPVLEADILKFHVSPNLCQVNRIRRVSEVRRQLQDVHEPVETGDTFLIQPPKIDQLLNRIDENADAQEVGQQVG